MWRQHIAKQTPKNGGDTRMNKLNVILQQKNVSRTQRTMLPAKSKLPKHF